MHATASDSRPWTFYALTLCFALFLAFLYGPMLVIYVLSFQGPEGGLTFPMNGFSTRWFHELIEQWTQRRHRRDLHTLDRTGRGRCRRHRGAVRQRRPRLPPPLPWFGGGLLHGDRQPGDARSVRGPRRFTGLSVAGLADRLADLRPRHPTDVDLAVRAAGDVRGDRPLQPFATRRPRAIWAPPPGRGRAR